MYGNLIDLHAHILPHLDDGARNIIQSVAMARAAVHDGIRTVVATTHFYENRSRGLLGRRLEALTALRETLHREEIPLEVLPGFEVNATHSLLTRRSLGSLSLAGTRWILLERPYVYGDEFDAVADFAFAQGLTPLIAHPERYSDFTADPRPLEKWTKRGAWCQITATALIGQHGGDTQKWCLRAIEDGLVHIVATDMHNLGSRAPKLQAAAELVEKEFGAETVRKLFYTNPGRLLGRRL